MSLRILNKAKCTFNVDQISSNFINGWVANKTEEIDFEFDIYVNGYLRASSVTPNIHRPDVEKMFGKKGKFGFSVEFVQPIDSEFATVEFIGSKNRRHYGKFEGKVPKFTGQLDCLEIDKIVGWVYDNFSNRAPIFDIYVDQQIVASNVVTSIFRPDLQSLRDIAPLGFSVQIPSTVKFEKTSVIGLFDSKTRELIFENKAVDLVGAEYFVERAKILPQELNSNEDYELIEPFFDKEFYANLAGLKPNDDPIRHYLEGGWKMYFDPAPWFSSSYYLSMNLDVFAAGINPFVHYIKFGIDENRSPNAEENTQYYLNKPWISEDGNIVIDYCARNGGNVEILGFARHQLYPGMATRLEVGLLDRTKVTVLARQDLEFSSTEALAGFDFSDFKRFKVNLLSDQFGDDIEVQFKILETDKIYRMEFSEHEHELIQRTIVRPNPDWDVVGVVDSVTNSSIAGWAMYKASPNTPLSLALKLEGKTIAIATCRIFRADVMKVFGGDGYFGYSFELPPEVASSSNELEYQVVPVVGRCDEKLFRRSHGKIDRHHTVGFDPLFPAHFEPIVYGNKNIEDDEYNQTVSAIVLNLDGAELLQDLLESAYEHEDINKIEWIIIDHGSSDNSKEIAQSASVRGQDVKFVYRSANQSFSASNNFGASVAKHNILVFMNNDLIITSEFRKNLVRNLSNGDVGAVGSILYDYLPKECKNMVPPVQHIGVGFERKIRTNRLRPVELRPIGNQMQQLEEFGTVFEVPVVTGAVVAMRREDFTKIGGFNENYVYGLEDVDLCLKVRAQLRKKIACDLGTNIIHHRGFTRSQERNSTIRHRNNNNYFNSNWSSALRAIVKAEVLTKPGFWTGATPVVAFIVANAGDETNAGEYFTALELGRSMQEVLNCQIRFLTPDDWYDLENVDILVVMVAHFDILKVKSVNPYIITINWTRQWFDRWVESGTLYAYDYVFASSQLAADYIYENTNLTATVLPIATNFNHFSNGNYSEELKSDYCFTGSYMGAKRELMYQLLPENIEAEGAVFGHNWEGTNFEKICRGPIPYSKMRDVYASTKIVIDDANIATKEWGSCNSRIFDAIAAGCLIISNGSKGVNELFGDLVPTFDSSESLKETIEYWVKNESERKARVSKLQELVKENHTYEKRASVVSNTLLKAPPKRKIAIKCAAKSAEKQNWGDYHFANSLAKELRKLDFTVRVDCVENWNTPYSKSDDLNIVLRGLSKFKPLPHQKNILWLISHPLDISFSELEAYDHVYVASDVHQKVLADAISAPVETLLQCTDVEAFHFETVNSELRGSSKPLFVGSSRGVFRPSVKWATELGHEIDIYGVGWEPFLEEKKIKGQFIPNDLVSKYYAGASIVLCDHWDDMRKLGYISNRVFDVLASGGWLAVDHVSGLQELLPDGYELFESSSDLDKIFNAKSFGSEKRKRALAEWVTKNHTFTQRAKVIADRIDSLISNGLEI